jgi:hypothetical protein
VKKRPSIIEITHTDDVVPHSFRALVFSSTFSGIPLLLADMQITDCGDTSALRYRNLDASGVDIKVEEEQPQETETKHTTEAVGYMVLVP